LEQWELMLSDGYASRSARQTRLNGCLLLCLKVVYHSKYIDLSVHALRREHFLQVELADSQLKINDVKLLFSSKLYSIGIQTGYF
jgi:hypothetical protein